MFVALDEIRSLMFQALAERRLPVTVEAVANDTRTAALALPGELLDPRLSGLLPAASAFCGPILPRTLGEHYEHLMSAGRRARGRFYTPEAVSAELAQRVVLPALAERGAAQVRVCDPAMGAGGFLLAALGCAAPRERRALASGLFGMELDPSAACVARAAVNLALLDAGADAIDLRASLRAGDALLDPIESWGQFDAVIGNPPYVASARMARESPGLRRRISRRWATARGNWDLFVPFVELSLGLLRPGGRCALLVPNRLLGADYAAAARRLLAEHQLVALLDYSQAQLFDAEVYPIAIVVRRGEPDPESRHVQCGPDTWWPLLSPRRTLDPVSLRGLVPLAELAPVREAATVAEAYLLVDLIEELPDDALPPGYLRIVNTGTIDRFETSWGMRRMRYLGRSFLRPAVKIAAIRQLLTRHEPDGQGMIVVAGLSRQIEAYADPTGTVFPAKTTMIIKPKTADFWPLVAVLNSRMATALYREQNGGLALRDGYLRVGARQVGRLPVPLDLPGELGQLAQARTLASGEEAAQLDAQIDGIVDQLYGQ